MLFFIRVKSFKCGDDGDFHLRPVGVSFISPYARNVRVHPKTFAMVTRR
jgi:hypothetical protein